MDRNEGRPQNGEDPQGDRQGHRQTGEKEKAERKKEKKEEEMSSKSLVGKVKGARKFVKSKDLPKGGGVGKAVTPVSSGKKKRKKR
jgi:hypothetical protein